MSAIGFAKEILGINRESIYNLRHQFCERTKVFVDFKPRQACITDKQAKQTNSLPEVVEEIIDKEKVDMEGSRKEQREEEPKVQKRKKSIEGNLKKILREYNYTSENVKIAKEYVQKCKQEFKDKKFKQEKLQLLEDAIVFMQGGKEDIEFFSKVCISFREYKKASLFIMDNINNESVRFEEKKKLRRLHEGIRYAMKREDAFDLLLRGVDERKVRQHTGVFEVDIVRMKRRIMGENRIKNTADKRGDEK